jgi:3-methylcrotonyl-CoA carboxylase alpha subunit
VEFRYEVAGQTTTVRVEAAVDGGYAVTLAGRTYQVKAITSRPGEIAMEIDGLRRCLTYVAADGSSRWVAVASGGAAGDGQAFVLTVPEAGRRSRHGPAGGHEALEAQMPGLVRQVLVSDGQAVERGQALVLLEAMKMEIRVAAPHAGVVQRVAVTAGQAVERGQLLVDLAQAPDPPA